MSIVIDRFGNRRELREGEIIRDGERLILGGITLMDSARHTLHDGMGNAAGHKPGYVFSSRMSGDQRPSQAYADYVATTSDAWRDKSAQPQESGSDASPRDAYIAQLKSAWRGGR